MRGPRLRECSPSRPIRRHQPLDPLAVDRLPGPLQGCRHPPAAVERGLEVLLVDPPHQPQVLLRLGRRREVVGRAVEAQKFALTTNAQTDELSGSTSPRLGSTAAGNAFFQPFDLHVEPADPLVEFGLDGLALPRARAVRPSRKRDSMPSRSCFFHWLIWTGWTWYALASSATVLVCLAASRATLALKAAGVTLAFAGHDAPRDGSATFDQYNIPSCPVSGVHFIEPAE